MLNKCNTSLLFHSQVSTSPNQKGNPVLTLTKECMRVEFSFFSLSSAIEPVRKLAQQSEGWLTSGHWMAPEMCVPSYATHWRWAILHILAGTLSLSLLLFQPGGWSPATPGSHSGPFWGPAPLGDTRRAGYESHSLRRVPTPTPTPFPPGENMSSSFSSNRQNLPPSQYPGWFLFKNPMLLEKQAYESNCLKAISAFMDHKLL